VPWRRRSKDGPTPHEGAPQHPNRLLAALPADDFARLQPRFTRVALPFSHRLQKQGAPITRVYFPSGAVCSGTHAMSDGRMVEIATVGGEGVVNIEALFGADIQEHDVIVQVPVADGFAEALDAEVFREEVARSAPFRDLMMRYAHAYVVMSTQCTACNGLHTVEERCARWLLMTHDRARQDTFKISQEYLAAMLGVRRATVTLVAGAFRRAGLIDYQRSQMTIRDRKGLGNAACECYDLLRSTFERVLPPAG
jgi:CRP-like cAMP-binding protein